ncbi:hypothetical protein F0365_07990 [Nonlabens sp. Ci31]|jgi:hypothetical protein|uniref:hypothetical protein n=1 Tax=Nonlabens sp. Ci31 TaxID=2608253 RepID=UPI0014643965|nr:hypothetical protein [Nonlabens sp. Ci31]QJP34341.1 hypothetical protein F0365_07990 [Nonlabens sp. Ci31]
MDKKLNSREKLNQKIKSLIDGLSQNLKVSSDIKSDVVKGQRFELGAEMRDIEKNLESLIEQLEKMADGNLNNKESR